MAGGICIYVEHTDGVLEPVTSELVSAAQALNAKTGWPIQALLLAEQLEPLLLQLSSMPFHSVFALDTKGLSPFAHDGLSEAIAAALRDIRPNAVLIPASFHARSLFPRVALKLDTGLTADCTALFVEQQEDGTPYIRQDKPSFGDQIMVSILHKQNAVPAMMTIRPGVYPPCKVQSAISQVIHRLTQGVLPASQITFLESLPASSDADNLSGAQAVLVVGRGMLEGERLALAKRFAAKIDAALAGTRPLADEGYLPFSRQIGQTGCTIRPQIYISCGVSGAIQHTEGIQDAKLSIAINSDPNAAIFSTVQYGIVADAGDVLSHALKLLEEK